MPVYNVFEATNSRLRKNKTSSDSKTATGKVATREELEKVGHARGWTARPLTARELQEMDSIQYRWHEFYNRQNLEVALQSPGKEVSEEARELTYEEIQKMSATEAAWHQLHNAENWRVAFEKEEIRRTNKKHMKVWDVRRQWREGVTEEQSSRAQEAGAEFARRFPTFEKTLENAHAIVQFMEDKDLDATEVASYITAYRELTDQGKLTVAPVQSADQYLAAHAELHDRRTPPLIQVREAKAAQTAKHFEAAANATAKGTVVNFTDYAADETGYPNYPSKYSFRRLVESLDADSYARRLKDDPQFSAAIDKLNNDK